MTVRGRRVFWHGTVLLLAGVVLAGCGPGSGAGSSTTPLSSTPATGSTGTSATAGTARPEAWVRGTYVTLTNGTGKTVEVGSLSGYGDKMPETEETALAAGASRTESEEWRSAEGTSVAFRVVYAKDDVLELRICNPAVGTPGVMWRKGYSVMNWSSTGQYAIDGDETFDEDTSRSLDMEGHTVTVSRGKDDGDNKNWTLTLDG